MNVVCLLLLDSLEKPGCDSHSHHAAWSQRQIASASQITSENASTIRSSITTHSCSLNNDNVPLTFTLYVPYAISPALPRIRQARWRHRQSTSKTPTAALVFSRSSSLRTSQRSPDSNSPPTGSTSLRIPRSSMARTQGLLRDAAKDLRGRR